MAPVRTTAEVIAHLQGQREQLSETAVQMLEELLKLEPQQ